MKISCSSWSYHRTFDAEKLSQISWIDLCAKKLKLDGVELLSNHFPSVEKTTRTKTSDLIELGNHRLLCGDSTIKEKVDKILLDKTWGPIITFLSL